MNRKFIIQWYRWQSCWCEVVDGVIGILTLGYVRPGLAFKSTIKASMIQSKWACEDSERRMEWLNSIDEWKE